jgi:hypothetical protein
MAALKRLKEPLKSDLNIIYCFDIPAVFKNTYYSLQQTFLMKLNSAAFSISPSMFNDTVQNMLFHL